MQKSIKFRIIAGVLFGGGLLVTTTPVRATLTYPVSGGSYTANVAVRYDANGNLLDSISGVLAGGAATQYGSVNGLIDYGPGSWNLAGIGPGATATFTETLDQTYLLNEIKTFYEPTMVATQYQIRVSTDGLNWSVVVPKQVTGFGTIETSTFTATNAKYIEWTIYGPGQLFGAPGTYAYPSELQAFVASTAPSPGMGFNVMSAGTLISQVGGSLALAFDNNPGKLDYAIPGPAGMTNVVDLGSVTQLTHLNFAFYPGQTWNNASVDVSTNDVNWVTLVNSNNLGTSEFTFSPTDARYVRLGGWGSGALVEFSAFNYVVPEPTTFLLLGIGGLMIWWKVRKVRA